MRWPSVYRSDEYFAPTIWLPTWRGWVVIVIDVSGTPWWKRCIRTIWI